MQLNAHLPRQALCAKGLRERERLPEWHSGLCRTPGAAPNAASALACSSRAGDRATSSTGPTQMRQPGVLLERSEHRLARTTVDGAPQLTRELEVFQGERPCLLRAPDVAVLGALRGKGGVNDLA